jgi:hypothetical protein
MYICLDIRVVPSPNEGSGAAIPGATESYDRATEASVPAGPVGPQGQILAKIESRYLGVE